MTVKKFVFLLRPMTLVTILWTLLRVSGLDFGAVMPKPAGLIMILVMTAALVFEFVMSKDIAAVVFSRDVLFAGVNLLLAASLVTSLLWWEARAVTLTDVLLALMVLTDFWVGTTNSYATALRNFSGQVNQGSNHNHEGVGES